jgi:hypothetical protein
MDNAALTLLIVVSSVLSVFLVLLSIAAYYFIRVMKRLDRVVDHAEQVADSVEAAASAFEKTATPMAVIKLISNIVSQVQKRKKE